MAQNPLYAPASTMILARQWATRVILPVLGRLEFGDGAVALNLLLGTVAQETGFLYLAQLDGGPARGFFQIEPATHDDVIRHFVAFNPSIAAVLNDLAAPHDDPVTQLDTNLKYAAAIARLIYRRAPEPLPATSDPALLGAYWKAHYNTPSGAGTVAEFVANFALHIGDPIDV